MKPFFLLVLLFGLHLCLSAQQKYTYTIKADSVRLTGCDSTELIIENHSQAVSGFLYNTGHGRTVFKKALTKVNNSLYLIGSDSLQVPVNAWVQGGNAFGTTGIVGTKDNNHLDFYIGNFRRMRLDSTGELLIGAATSSNQFRLDVFGGMNVTGYQTIMANATDSSGAIKLNPSYTNAYAPGVDGSVLTFGNVAGSVGINTQALGNIPTGSLILGGAAPGHYTTLVDYNRNPLFIVDGGGTAIINGGFFGIGPGGATAQVADYGSQDFTINGPRGTGTGRTGDIILATANPATAGLNIHSMSSRWWIKGSTGFLANNSAPTSTIDVMGPNGYSQFRMRTSYTPGSSTDTNGNVGDFSWDENYFYIKTAAGWKRAPLTAF